MLLIRKSVAIFLVFTLLDFGGVSNQILASIDSESTHSQKNKAEIQVSATFSPDILKQSKYQPYIMTGRFSSSPLRDAPFFIHVRDLHCNDDAQMNIAKMLETLSKENPKSKFLILTEGADGLVNTSLFADFPDRGPKLEASKNFMKAGKMTGPEFLSITKNDEVEIEIQGIEDADLYAQNLKAFREVLGKTEEIGSFVEEIEQILKQLKLKVFSKELSEFDEKKMEYQKSDLSLDQYVSYFNEIYPEKVKEFSNLKLLVEVLKRQKEIDLEKVEEQRSEVMDALGEKVERNELAKMIKESLEFRLGRMSASEYFDDILEMMQTYLKEADYPELLNYIKLVKLQSNVDHQGLSDEIDQLTDRVRESLIKNDREREIIKFERTFEVIRRMLRLEMTREDLAFYQGNPDICRIEVIEKSLNQMILRSSLDLPQMVENAEKIKMVAGIFENGKRFYDVALKRDEVMVAKALKIMDEKTHEENIDGNGKENRKLVAVLITGGFHSDGVTKILSKKEVPYMVVTPKVGRTPDMKNYYALMMDERISIKALSFFSLFNNKIAAKISSEMQIDLLREFLKDLLTLAEKRKVDSGILRSWVQREIGKEGMDDVRQKLIDEVDQRLKSVEVAPNRLSVAVTDEEIGQLIGKGSLLVGELTVEVLKEMGDPRWENANRELEKRRIDLANPSPVFKSIDEMEERLPKMILNLLKESGLEDQEIDRAREMMEWMENFYDQMGLRKLNYHNFIHNLGVTYGALLLAKRSGWARNTRDAKTVFLAGMFHDFHLRQANVVDQQGQLKGNPAFVEETIREMADLFGFEPDRGPPVETRYKELMSQDQKQQFRRIFSGFIMTGDMRAVYSEIVAMIRRTDFASDVAPLPPAYKSRTTGLRISMDQLILKGMDLNLIQEGMRDAYFRLELDVDLDDNISPEKKDSVKASLKRQYGIEAAYVEALMKVNPLRTLRVHQLAVRQEKGADQSAFYWFGIPEAVEQIVEGLRVEVPTASAVGSYPFFFRAELLIPTVLDILKDLPFDYRKNFIEVMRYFSKKSTVAAKGMPDSVPVKALIQSSQGHWEGIEQEVGKQLGLMIGETIEKGVVPRTELALRTQKGVSDGEPEKDDLRTHSIAANLFRGSLAWLKNLPAKLVFALAIPIQELTHLGLAKILGLPVQWTFGGLWSAVEIDYTRAPPWKGAVVRLGGLLSNLILGGITFAVFGPAAFSIATLFAVTNLILFVSDFLSSLILKRGDVWESIHAIQLGDGVYIGNQFYTLSEIARHIENDNSKARLAGIFYAFHLSERGRGKLRKLLNDQARRILDVEIYLEQNRDEVFYEMYQGLKKPSWMLDARPNRGELQSLEKEVFEISTRKGVVGHGVEAGKGGLETLLRVLLSGRLESENYGIINDADSEYSAGLHGPYYVIFGRQFPEGKEFQNTKNHEAYLVPEAKDRKFLIEMLNRAVKAGLIEEMVAREIIGKVITYGEFVLADGKIQTAKVFGVQEEDVDIGSLLAGGKQNGLNRMEVLIPLGRVFAKEAHPRTLAKWEVEVMVDGINGNYGLDIFTLGRYSVAEVLLNILEFHSRILTAEERQMVLDALKDFFGLNGTVKADGNLEEMTEHFEEFKPVERLQRIEASLAKEQGLKASDRVVQIGASADGKSEVFKEIGGERYPVFSQSPDWEKIVIDEAEIRRFVPRELLILFEVSEKAEIPIVLTGGTARDFAIGWLTKGELKHPKSADDDVAFPYVVGKELDNPMDLGMNDKSIEFEGILARVIREEVGAGRINPRDKILDPTEGTYSDEERDYVFEGLLGMKKNMHLRNAFTVSHLAVEKMGHQYVVFGHPSAIRDLKDRKLRLVGEAPLVPGYLAKQLGKYAMYREVGFELDAETKRKILDAIKSIDHPEEQNKFLGMIALFARTTVDLEPSTERLANVIRELNLDRLLGRSTEELLEQAIFSLERKAHMESLALKKSGPMAWRGRVVETEGIENIKRDAKKDSTYLGVIRGKRVYVDNALMAKYAAFNMDQKSFRRFLKEYIEEQFKTSSPVQKEIIIAELSSSSHFFEDHHANGFVGINAQLFDPQISTVLRLKLFKLGLRHELLHEALVYEKAVLKDEARQGLLADERGALLTPEAIDNLSRYEILRLIQPYMGEVEQKMLRSDIDHMTGMGGISVDEAKVLGDSVKENSLISHDTYLTQEKKYEWAVEYDGKTIKVVVEKQAEHPEDRENLWRMEFFNPDGISLGYVSFDDRYDEKELVAVQYFVKPDFRTLGLSRFLNLTFKTISEKVDIFNRHSNTRTTDVVNPFMAKSLLATGFIPHPDFDGIEVIMGKKNANGKTPIFIKDTATRKQFEQWIKGARTQKDYGDFILLDQAPTEIDTRVFIGVPYVPSVGITQKHLGTAGVNETDVKQIISGLELKRDVSEADRSQLQSMMDLMNSPEKIARIAEELKKVSLDPDLIGIHSLIQVLQSIAQGNTETRIQYNGIPYTIRIRLAQGPLGVDAHALTYREGNVIEIAIANGHLDALPHELIEALLLTRPENKSPPEDAKKLRERAIHTKMVLVEPLFDPTLKPAEQVIDGRVKGRIALELAGYSKRKLDALVSGTKGAIADINEKKSAGVLDQASADLAELLADEVVKYIRTDPAVRGIEAGSALEKETLRQVVRFYRRRAKDLRFKAFFEQALDFEIRIAQDEKYASFVHGGDRDILHYGAKLLRTDISPQTRLFFLRSAADHFRRPLFEVVEDDVKYFLMLNQNERGKIISDMRAMSGDDPRMKNYIHLFTVAEALNNHQTVRGKLKLDPDLKREIALFTGLEHKDVELGDGTRIHYSVGGANDSPITLVFLHGWLLNSRDWRLQLAYLEGKYRTITIDTPGFGKSIIGKKKPSMKYYAKALRAVLDKENARPVVIIGHSMGGMIAMHYEDLYAKEERRVEGFVPIATSAVVTRQGILNFFTRKFLRMNIEFLMFTPAFAALSMLWTRDLLVRILRTGTAKSMIWKMLKEKVLPPDLLEYFERALSSVVKTPLDGIVDALVAIMDHNTLKRLKDVQVPVLWIIGENDGVLSPEMQRSQLANLREVETAVFEGASHFPQISNPRGVNRVIDRFVQNMVIPRIQMAPEAELTGVSPSAKNGPAGVTQKHIGTAGIKDFDIPRIIAGLEIKERAGGSEIEQAQRMLSLVRSPQKQIAIDSELRKIGLNLDAIGLDALIKVLKAIARGETEVQVEYDEQPYTIRIKLAKGSLGVDAHALTYQEGNLIEIAIADGHLDALPHELIEALLLTLPENKSPPEDVKKLREHAIHTKMVLAEPLFDLGISSMDRIINGQVKGRVSKELWESPREKLESLISGTDEAIVDIQWKERAGVLDLRSARLASYLAQDISSYAKEVLRLKDLTVKVGEKSEQRVKSGNKELIVKNFFYQNRTFIQIGSRVYEVREGIQAIRLEDLLKDPLLWIGNAELVDFFGEDALQYPEEIRGPPSLMLVEWNDELRKAVPEPPMIGRRYLNQAYRRMKSAHLGSFLKAHYSLLIYFYDVSFNPKLPYSALRIVSRISEQRTNEFIYHLLGIRNVDVPQTVSLQFLKFRTLLEKMSVLADIEILMSDPSNLGDEKIENVVMGRLNSILGQLEGKDIHAFKSMGEVNQKINELAEENINLFSYDPVTKTLTINLKQIARERRGMERQREQVVFKKRGPPVQERDRIIVEALAYLTKRGHSTVVNRVARVLSGWAQGWAVNAVLQGIAGNHRIVLDSSNRNFLRNVAVGIGLSSWGLGASHVVLNDTPEGFLKNVSLGVGRSGWGLGGASVETETWLRDIFSNFLDKMKVIAGVKRDGTPYVAEQVYFGPKVDKQRDVTGEPLIDAYNYKDLVRDIFSNEPMTSDQLKDLQDRYDVAVEKTKEALKKWILDNHLRVVMFGQVVLPDENPVFYPALLAALNEINAARSPEERVVAFLRHNYFRKKVLPREGLRLRVAQKEDPIDIFVESDVNAEIFEEQFGFRPSILSEAVHFPEVEGRSEQTFREQIRGQESLQIPDENFARRINEVALEQRKEPVNLKEDIIITQPSRVDTNKRPDSTVILAKNIQKIENEKAKAEGREPRKVRVLFLGTTVRVGPEGRSEVSGTEKDAFEMIQTLAKKSELENDLDISRQIYFLGYVPQQEVIAALTHTDVMAQASDRETFGRTPIEAIASGVPVIYVRNWTYPFYEGDRQVFFQLFGGMRLSALKPGHTDQNGEWIKGESAPEVAAGEIPFMHRMIYEILNNPELQEKIARMNFYRARRSMLNIKNIENFLRLRFLAYFDTRGALLRFKDSDESKTDRTLDTKLPPPILTSELPSAQISETEGITKDAVASLLYERFGIKTIMGEKQFQVDATSLRESDWTMNGIRPAEEGRIYQEIDEMPEAKLRYSLDLVPILSKQGTNSTVHLGWIEGVDHPVAIKMFLKERKTFISDERDELVKAQIFDRLGISPRFLGVIRTPDGRLGYAMQIVPGKDYEGNDIEKRDGVEILMRTSKIGMTSSAKIETPSGNLVTIDPGNADIFNGQAYRAFMNRMNGKNPLTVGIESLAVKNGGPMSWKGERVTDQNLDSIKEKVKADSVFLGEIRGKKVYIESDLIDRYEFLGFQYPVEFQNYLIGFLTKQFEKNLPVRDEIVIAKLDSSFYLFEDHYANGFIGINNHFFAKGLSSETRRSLFELGLGHELMHEALSMERAVLRRMARVHQLKDPDGASLSEKSVNQLGRDEVIELIAYHGLEDKVERVMFLSDWRRSQTLPISPAEFGEWRVLMDDSPLKIKMFEEVIFTGFIKNGVSSKELERYIEIKRSEEAIPYNDPVVRLEAITLKAYTVDTTLGQSARIAIFERIKDRIQEIEKTQGPIQSAVSPVRVQTKEVTEGPVEEIIELTQPPSDQEKSLLIEEAKRLNEDQGWIGRKNDRVLLRLKTPFLKRHVVIGDVHAELSALKQDLRDAGLVDVDGNWIGGNVVVVQIGDAIDRGPAPLEVDEYLRKLQKQARGQGGNVVRLIGNHEFMFYRGVKDDLRQFVEWVMNQSSDEFGKKVRDMMDDYETLRAILRGEIETADPDFKKWARLYQNMDQDIERGNIQIAYAYQEALFVHAGVNKYMVRGKTAKEVAEELNQSFKVGQYFPAIFEAIWNRNPKTNAPDFIQFVGHNVGYETRVIGRKIVNADVGQTRYYNGNRGYIDIQGREARGIDLARFGESVVESPRIGLSMVSGNLVLPVQSTPLNTEEFVPQDLDTEILVLNLAREDGPELRVFYNGKQFVLFSPDGSFSMVVEGDPITIGRKDGKSMMQFPDDGKDPKISDVQVILRTNDFGNLVVTHQGQNPTYFKGDPFEEVEDLRIVVRLLVGPLISQGLPIREVAKQLGEFLSQRVFPILQDSQMESEAVRISAEEMRKAFRSLLPVPVSHHVLAKEDKEKMSQGLSKAMGVPMSRIDALWDRLDEEGIVGPMWVDKNGNVKASRLFQRVLEKFMELSGLGKQKGQERAGDRIRERLYHEYAHQMIKASWTENLSSQMRNFAESEDQESFMHRFVERYGTQDPEEILAKFISYTYTGEDRDLFEIEAKDGLTIADKLGDTGILGNVVFYRIAVKKGEEGKIVDEIFEKSPGLRSRIDKTRPVTSLKSILIEYRDLKIRGVQNEQLPEKFKLVSGLLNSLIKGQDGDGLPLSLAQMLIGEGGTSKKDQIRKFKNLSTQVMPRIDYKSQRRANTSIRRMIVNEASPVLRLWDQLVKTEIFRWEGKTEDRNIYVVDIRTLVERVGERDGKIKLEGVGVGVDQILEKMFGVKPGTRVQLMSPYGNEKTREILNNLGVADDRIGEGAGQIRVVEDWSSQGTLENILKAALGVETLEGEARVNAQSSVVVVLSEETQKTLRDMERYKNEMKVVVGKLGKGAGSQMISDVLGLALVLGSVDKAFENGKMTDAVQNKIKQMMIQLAKEYFRDQKDEEILKKADEIVSEIQKDGFFRLPPWTENLDQMMRELAIEESYFEVSA